MQGDATFCLPGGSSAGNLFLLLLPSCLMNKFYAFLTLLFAVGGATSACAQDRVLATPSVAADHVRPFQVAYLRASVGLNPTIGWEYRCPRVAVEYAPMLTRHLGLAGRLAGSAGQPSASTGLYGSWIKDIPNQN